MGDDPTEDDETGKADANAGGGDDERKVIDFRQAALRRGRADPNAEINRLIIESGLDEIVDQLEASLLRWEEADRLDDRAATLRRKAKALKYDGSPSDRIRQLEADADRLEQMAERLRSQDG